MADGATPYLSKRFFRGLSDSELLAWRPQAERGIFGCSYMAKCSNVSAANREMRRRAKVGGFNGPYDWIAKMRATYSTSPASTAPHTPA